MSKESKSSRSEWFKWFFKYRIMKPHLLASDVKWWILHRTFNRFNKIEMPTLEPGYYDSDTRMLHGAFNLLTDFVEKEKPFERIDWDYDEAHRHAAKEIKELYDWWKCSYLKRRSLLDDIPPNHQPHLFEFCKEEPNGDLSYGQAERQASEKAYPIYHEAFSLQMKQEAMWDKEETENLIRLVKIRGYLWT